MHNLKKFNCTYTHPWSHSISHFGTQCRQRKMIRLGQQRVASDETIDTTEHFQHIHASNAIKNNHLITLSQKYTDPKLDLVECSRNFLNPKLDLVECSRNFFFWQDLRKRNSMLSTDSGLTVLDRFNRLVCCSTAPCSETQLNSRTNENNTHKRTQL